MTQSDLRPQSSPEVAGSNSRNAGARRIFYTRGETFPQWCFACARQAWDNACGHFPGPVSYTPCDCTGCLLLMPDMCDNDPRNWDVSDGGQ